MLCLLFSVSAGFLFLISFDQTEADNNAISHDLARFPPLLRFVFSLLDELRLYGLCACDL